MSTLPEGTGKKNYVVGCESSSDWEYIHTALEHPNWTLDEEIPTEHCDCLNNEKVGSTRGVFSLTDDEVEILKNHPKVSYVHLDQSSYREDLKIPVEQRLFDLYNQKIHWRYNKEVVNYRVLPSSSTISQNPNRTGYQLLRGAAKRDIWHAAAELNNFSATDLYEFLPINGRIAHTGTGKDVDLIVADVGTWHAHPEFMNNLTGVEYPRDYVPGNVLPGNGTSDVLDLVLDAPYYIDPEWFDADPDNRLTTRWDGTIVPVESVARSWWTSSSQRSVSFSSVGTVSVPSQYTRARACGDQHQVNTGGYHGTSCAAQAYGRSQGWAYNANKWSVDALVNLYDDEYFDIVTIFHQNKPINPKYGTKDPTLTSNSWGSGLDVGLIDRRSGFCYYRPTSASTVGTGVSWQLSSSGSFFSASNPLASNTSNTKPKWFRWIGWYGGGQAIQNYALPQAALTAGNNCVNSGVIVVVAAGNQQQKQVFSNHPDYNNHYNNTVQSTRLTNNIRTDTANMTWYRTTNRVGFPQQLGETFSSEKGRNEYKTISVGALDDAYITETVGLTTYAKEIKALYSNAGEVIDVYAAADGTLAATNDTSTYLRPDSVYYQSADSIGIKTTVTGGYSGICAGSSIKAQGVNFIPEGGYITNSNNEYDSYVIYKPNTGHRFTTSGTKLLNPTVTYSEIESSLRGNSVGIASTIPTLGANKTWVVDLPFQVEYFGVGVSTVYVDTTSAISFIPYPSYYQGSYSTRRNCGTAINGYTAEMAINSNFLSPYLGIRTEVIGSSPNRQFWIRYEATSGSYQTSGDIDLSWEVTFYENNPTQIDVQIGTNVFLTETPPITEFYDRSFSGTSAACPITAGIIATKLEYNRDWNYQDIRNWIETRVGLANTESEFYLGEEASSENDLNWDDNRSLNGSRPIVMWNAPTDEDPKIEKVTRVNPGSNMKISGSKISLTFRNNIN